MSNIVDQKLYQKVKKEADKIYERHGLYKSAWIQKEYQKRGGRYRGTKPNQNKGLQRWLAGERWIEVEPYLKDGKEVICGTSERKGKACRPLKRVNEQTPITIDELLEIHSKQKLLKLAKQKKNNMDGRVNWKKGTFKEK